MKRIHPSEIDRIAAAVVRDLICRHGAVNLARLYLAIRREAKRQLETCRKNLSQNSNFAIDVSKNGR